MPYALSQGFEPQRAPREALDVIAREMERRIIGDPGAEPHDREVMSAVSFVRYDGGTADEPDHIAVVGTDRRALHPSGPAQAPELWIRRIGTDIAITRPERHGLDNDRVRELPLSRFPIGRDLDGLAVDVCNRIEMVLGILLLTPQS